MVCEFLKPWQQVGTNYAPSTYKLTISLKRLLRIALLKRLVVAFLETNALACRKAGCFLPC